jgi:xanthine dehydrogenase accessory factor
VVLATVTAAHGSTPRVAGARQLLTAAGTTAGTVGGGVMESRVLELAKQTLEDGHFRSLEADLCGEMDDVRDGVCGGRMTIWLSRLEGAEALNVVEEIERSLQVGRCVTLATRKEGLALVEHSVATGLHDGEFIEVLEPSPRLLIVGAGHVGRALAWQMIQLGFVAAIQDDRRGFLVPEDFPMECELESDLESCAQRLRVWEGRRHTALVTRGFRQDVEALKRLADGGGVGWLDYLGVLGSKKRIATVFAACRKAGLPAFSNDVLHAPIGVEIGAETPEEIAVSIAAEIINKLRRGKGARDS